MKRGELYRVYKPGHGDPRAYRIFVVVSRQALIDSRFNTVICAPVFTHGEGLSTQVPVNTSEGLKHASWIKCDNLTSISKTELTSYVGSLSKLKVRELDQALRFALELH